MAPDEYSIGGGKLKLKGSKVNDGRVEKKKKKKGLRKKDAAESGDAQSQDLGESQATKEKDQQELNDEEADQPADAGSSKTETEKKYEEIRKKRVCITSHRRSPWYMIYAHHAFPYVISMKWRYRILTKVLVTRAAAAGRRQNSQGAGGRPEQVPQPIE